MKKRENKNAKYYYYFSLVFLLIFIYILIDVKKNLFLSNIDLSLNYFFYEIQNEFLINISKIITNIFHPLIFISLSLIILIYLYYKKRKKEAFLFAIMISLAKIIGVIIKEIVQRTRPENILVSENSFSFPSAHALMAVIFFGILVYIFDLHIKSKSKKIILTIFASFFALIMGFTRITLNAHWFTDVLAGFSLGLFILFAFISFVKREKILI